MARILVTSSRMPFALDEIRKLGRLEHDIIATDTFSTSPGSHSTYVEEAIVVPSPRYDTEGYIQAIESIVTSRAIDVILPMFEEVFYLARHHERIARHAKLFAPPFETLAMLHDKARFLELARALGQPLPRTILASDPRELAEAARTLGQFFARPSYSRGGVNLFTNVGPLAGTLDLDHCVPTPGNPWLVQEFVHGLDLCTFSVVHHGHVVAHSTYVHPRTLEHAGGIVFESIDEGGTLAIVQKIADATGYHGQVSFDFMRTDRGLVLIECNPRPTAGVYMMDEEALGDALLHPRIGHTYVAPAGVTRKITVALLRDMVRHWQDAADDFAALLSRARDVYAQVDDMLPALYQFLSYSHVITYRRRRKVRNKRTDLMAAYFDDILWDGDAMTNDGNAWHDDEPDPQPASVPQPADAPA